MPRALCPASPPWCRVSPFWFLTKDADPRALALYERHYSCRRYKDGRVRRCFIGPGEKQVLITKHADALLVWRKFKSLNEQEGLYCSVFRNESRVLSSRLIQSAMQVAWLRWPGVRLYTYVNPRKVRSQNPGYCFLMAGWQRCGQTKGRLLIFEALPK